MHELSELHHLWDSIRLLSTEFVGLHSSSKCGGDIQAVQQPLLADSTTVCMMLLILTCERRDEAMVQMLYDTRR